VQSRIKALAKMDALIDVVEEHQTTFSFPEPDRIEGHILTCSNVKFGYHYNKILLDKVTCSVDMDSRIGVLGANGVGQCSLDIAAATHKLTHAAHRPARRLLPHRPRCIASRDPLLVVHSRSLSRSLRLAR